MTRVDLLALTEEDLQLLSNKGTVKRAVRELSEGEVSYELSEGEDGSVSVRWSDDVLCQLPTGKILSDGFCTCAAAGICRHLVRSVLAYQAEHAANMSAVAAPGAGDFAAVDGADTTGAGDGAAAVGLDTEAAVAGGGAASEGLPTSGGYVETDEALEVDQFAALTGAAPKAAAQAWNPGNISDEQLQRFFKPAALTRARRAFDAGIVVELVQSAKPFARFHSLSYTLKFLVPDDLRYTHCDCAENPPPCSHAALAVWAFRLLSPEQKSGILSTVSVKSAAPIALLDKLDDMLVAICVLGVGSAAQALLSRLKLAALECQEQGLIWPCEIINDLVLEIDRYRERDARFSATRVAELVAELAARCDAIRNDTLAMPQMFIRGAQTDRAVDIGTAKLTGLGCGGAVQRKRADLTAYFQDQITGNVVTLTREFEATEISKGSSFWKLAVKPVVKGASLRQLGAGLVTSKGGKLSPSREFKPGRGVINVNHQMYKWEGLKAPVYAESFAELRAVLAARPPAFLGPRYKGSSFYVCAVAAAVDARFSEIDQSLECELVDNLGEHARLSTPFLSRCAHGLEVLLKWLQERGADLRFVAGAVNSGRSGLHFHPVSCVFENETGRVLVQPWIDRQTAGESEEEQRMEEEIREHEISDHEISLDAVRVFPVRLLEQAGETLTSGLDRADRDLVYQWKILRGEADAMGFSLILNFLAQLSDNLEARKSRLDWDSEVAARHLLTLCVAALVAKEEVMR